MEKKKSNRLLAGLFSVVLLITSSFGTGGVTNGNLKATAATPETRITDNSLFHDQAAYFLSNIEPAAGEELTVRLRALDGLLSAAVLECYNEAEGSFYLKQPMTRSAKKYDKTGKYEYWEATVTVPETMFYYRFKVTNNSGDYYYCSFKGSDAYNAVSADEKDYTYCWKLLPGFSTPDWAKGASWYSIMPDAFFNGDTTNDDHDSDGNYDQPWNLTHNGLSDRYGGDLQGIADKADYIKQLGVSAVCYNPITECGQNGGYGAFNQNQIETTFGNGQKYSEFIKLMHNNGFRLVQDVAVYHTIRESIYYNASGRWPLAGYAQGEESPFYNMILKPITEAWGGIVLNNASSAAKNVLWAQSDSPLSRYVNETLGYGVDGYRFDCGGNITGKDENGNTVNTSTIIAGLRETVKKINPDALLISESSPYDQLNSGAWDGQWELNVGNHLRSTASNGNLFYTRNCLQAEKHNILRNAALCSHLQLTTHDIYGAVYGNGNDHFINAAKLIQMTTVGSPSIYYGEETNFSGRKFSTSAGASEGFSSFNWDESTWNYEVLNFHKALIELRNSYTALKDGAIYELKRPGNTSDKFYAYGRFDENGATVTYANTTENAVTRDVDVSLLGVADGETMTDWFTGRKYTVSSGTVRIEVPSGGTVIVTGDKKSSFIAGNRADEISADGGTKWVNNLTLRDSKPKDETGDNIGTADYYSLLADGDGGITLAKGDKYVFEMDVYFEVANTGNVGHMDRRYFGFNLLDGANSEYADIVFMNQYCGYRQKTTSYVPELARRQLWDKSKYHITYTVNAYKNVRVKLESYDKSGVKRVLLEGTAPWDDIWSLAGRTEKSDTVFKPNLMFRDIDGSVSDIKVTYVNKPELETDSDKTVSITGGIGSVSGTNDNLTFINKPVFNNYSYTAYVSGDSASESIVMARNSLENDSMYYAAIVGGGRITVKARKTRGAEPIVIAEAEKGNSDYIKIERSADNCYTVYIGNGSDYTPIADSYCKLQMNSRNYTGFAVLAGNAVLKQAEIKADGRTLYDDFNSDAVSSMLSGADDAGAVLSEGRLILPPNSTLTAKAFDNDWTFKAGISYCPENNNDYAGIICKQDEKSFVTAGRIKLDGKQKLFIAKSSNGRLVIEYTAEDKYPASDVTVQLQRIGTAYTAVYTYDSGKWYAIGSSVFYNLSDENPGITVSGNTEAKFDFVSFGDAIHDSESYNTPRTPDKALDLSGGEYNGTYKLKTVSGNWEYAAEGLYHTDSAPGRMAVSNKVYDSFRTEATFILEDGATWAGMSFGKAAFDSDESDGYLLKYTKSGYLVLEKNGTEIHSVYCGAGLGFLRVVLEVRNGKIKAYTGQNATPAMNLDVKGDTVGYFAYCTDGAAHINNYNVCTVNSEIYSADTARAFGDRVTVYRKSGSTKPAAAYLRNYAYTDFVMTATLSMHSADDASAYAGILLNGFIGADIGDGVFLKYSYDGKLRLLKNGTDLCEPYVIADAPKTVKLMLVKQDGSYAVYVSNGKTPVLEYSENIQSGGVIAFFSANATTSFSEIRTDELSAYDEAVKSSTYIYWTNKFKENRKTFTDDFSSSKLIGGDYYAYKGEWDISDGTLKTADYSNMSAGVTYIGSDYSDFVLTFKMKRSSKEASPGFAGVSFRKLSLQDRYDESGVTLAFYTHTLNLIKENNADVSSSYTNNSAPYVFTPDVWHNIKIICKGKSFEVYSDNALIFKGTDNEYGSGYITFRSGKTPVEFDDVKIEPIDTNHTEWVSDLTLRDSNPAVGTNKNKGTRDHYSLLTEDSAGITLNKGDRYVFEMDVYIDKNNAEPGVGQLDYRHFGFNLLEGANNALSDIVFWNQYCGYRQKGTGYVASANGKNQLWQNTKYRITYTVNAYESICVKTEVYSGDGAKKTVVEEIAPWSDIWSLADCTEESNAVFKPNLMFTDIDGTVSDIKVTYENTNTVFGDANGDGRVDILDLIRMKKYSADKKIKINLEGADMNGDRTVDSSDLVLLKKMLLSMAG